MQKTQCATGRVSASQQTTTKVGGKFDTGGRDQKSGGAKAKGSI